MINNSTNTATHPYREALHILLYNYPQGLSAIDIADKLQISDADCHILLQSEEFRGSIDVDPYSGTLMYKSTRIIKPDISLSAAIRKIHFSNLIKILTMVTITTTIAIVSFYACVQVITYLQNKSLQSQVDMEVKLKNKSELTAQKNDINQRISKIQNILINKKCEGDWQQNKNCYIEGRLLNREDLNQELKAMRIQVININELLRNSQAN